MNKMRMSYDTNEPPEERNRRAMRMKKTKVQLIDELEAYRRDHEYMKDQAHKCHMATVEIHIIKKDLEKQISAHHARISKMENELAAIHAQLGGLEGKVDPSSDSMKRLKALEDELAKLRKEFNPVADNVAVHLPKYLTTSMFADIKRHEEWLGTVDKNVRDAKKVIDGLGPRMDRIIAAMTGKASPPEHLNAPWPGVNITGASVYDSAGHCISSLDIRQAPPLQIPYFNAWVGRLRALYGEHAPKEGHSWMKMNGKDLYDLLVREWYELADTVNFYIPEERQQKEGELLDVALLAFVCWARSTMEHASDPGGKPAAEVEYRECMGCGTQLLDDDHIYFCEVCLRAEAEKIKKEYPDDKSGLLVGTRNHLEGMARGKRMTDFLIRERLKKRDEPNIMHDASEGDLELR